MKKIAFLLSASLVAFASQAENYTISASAHLSDLISEDAIATVTEVVVTSEDNSLLSAADMSLLASMPLLESLDLRGVGYERPTNCPSFNANKSIREIWWPNNVSFIGNNSATVMERMHLPAAFNNPSALTRLFNNPKLEVIDFYDGVPEPMTLEDGVIYGWGNTLCYYPSGKVPADGSVVIPEGITGIMSIGSLGYNPNIKSIVLPTSFTKPSNMRFLTEKNDNLECIYVTEGNPYLSTLFNDACLYDVEEKAILWTSSKIKFDEYMVIDGSLVESVPAGFLSGHSEVKNLKITEGYKSLVYGALKNANGIEVLELPESLESIAGEAMHSMSSLKFVITHAAADPLGEENEFFQVALHERSGSNYIGWTTFYGQPSDVKVCVPEGALDLYLNSGWNRDWTHAGYEYTNSSYGYTNEQFVEYAADALTIVDGEAFNGAVHPGMTVKVTARKPTSLNTRDNSEWEDYLLSFMKFEGWVDLNATDEVPGVEFADPSAEETTFVMPDRKVNLRAVYEIDWTETSVRGIETPEADAPAVFYDLQGRVVENPAPGLYIVRRGNHVSKQLIR